MTIANIPAWAAGILDGTVNTTILDGIVRVAVAGEDASIRFYRAVGGAHFQGRSTGRVVAADRDYAGVLIARLLYAGGVAGLLEQAGSRDAIDGNAAGLVRSRCFTADELAGEVQAIGLRVVASYGVSALSLILGYVRDMGKLVEGDDERLAHVGRLLVTLGRQGSIRRSHVIIAERPPRADVR